jgi:PilZ domain
MLTLPIGVLMTEPGNRRRVPRDATVQFATITLSDQSMLPCFVLDLSDLGARLNVPDVDRLPAAFSFRIESLARDLWCVVVWCNGDQIGVAFADPDGGS